MLLSCLMTKILEIRRCDTGLKKPSIYCVRHLEKVPYQQLVCRNDTGCLKKSGVENDRPHHPTAMNPNRMWKEREVL
jgi:hypothetical protein